MDDAMVWVLFVVCAAVIVVSGARLAVYGDIIAEKTGLGRTWIGLVLMASITSLPELVTGISAVAVFDLPDIAVGDVLGSCLVNLLILALLDVIGGDQPITTRAHQGHVMAAGFGILLLGLVAVSLLTDGGSVGWVGVSSLVLLGLYLLAMRVIFAHERRRQAQVAIERAEELQYEAVSTRRAVLLYGLFAAMLGAAAIFLPALAGRLAEVTGLGQTVIGSTLVALVTSLPEVVVAVAALRLGAIDLAVGNLLGSNLFNVAILAVDDLVSHQGPLLERVNPDQALTAVVAMAMTAITIIGLTDRAAKKWLVLGWDSVGIVLLYLGALVALVVSR